MDNPNAGTIINKMLNFDTMIGPVLIKIMYFIGLIGIAIAGLFMLFAGVMALGYQPAYGLLMILLSPIAVIIYALVWRFACEMWILMFKVYDRLGEIKDKLPG
ncbi:MAG: DUF4282 domain-containing protein [Pseudomonadota bacterium]